MNTFTIIYYMSILFIILFVPILICFAVEMVYVGMDAINTRSLECQNVIVENTSSINDGYGITFFVNEHVILDTADENNIKKWGRIEPGDVVYMKLGKQTAVFC